MTAGSSLFSGVDVGGGVELVVSVVNFGKPKINFSIYQIKTGPKKS